MYNSTVPFGRDTIQTHDRKLSSISLIAQVSRSQSLKDIFLLRVLNALFLSKLLHILPRCLHQSLCMTFVIDYAAYLHVVICVDLLHREITCIGEFLLRRLSTPTFLGSLGNAQGILISYQSIEAESQNSTS